MPRFNINPLAGLTSVLPVDLIHPSDAELSLIRDGMHELLLGANCHCNGERAAYNSAETTIHERIRGLAFSCHLDASILELATAKGVDVATAQPVEINSALTEDEIKSLAAHAMNLTQDQIDAVVTTEEKATIERAETHKGRRIRDPDWSHDIADIIGRVRPHVIERVITVTDLAGNESLVYFTETVAVKPETIFAEVDEYEEICCWMYEEPAITVED